MDQEVANGSPFPDLAEGEPAACSQAIIFDWQRETQVGPAVESGAGPVVGQLLKFDSQGRPLVRFEAVPGTMVAYARSVIALSEADVGGELVLLFERGDPSLPLVMGVLGAPRRRAVHGEVDGEQLVFSADREIVLRCGAASITLTCAGKFSFKAPMSSPSRPGQTASRGRLWRLTDHVAGAEPHPVRCPAVLDPRSRWG